MKRNVALWMLLVLLLSMLVLPASAQEGLYYVTDEADLLSDTDDYELETLCQSISEKYEIGVYIVAVEDFTDWGDGDVYDVTESLYHEYTMGKGEDCNGIMLLLSMEDRDYATFVYGADAEYAFGDYALQQLEEEFLPHFGENDWYQGFRIYAATCKEYLEKAQAQEPVTEESATEDAQEGKGMTYLIVIGASFLIALIVVSILKAGMKNVKLKREADVYVSRQLNLTQRHDRFTHMTTTKRKIETNSGSKAHSSSGGGHGRSGKF